MYEIIMCSICGLVEVENGMCKECFKSFQSLCKDMDKEIKLWAKSKTIKELFIKGKVCLNKDNLTYIEFNEFYKRLGDYDAE